MPQIEVSFNINENGLVEVTAKDLGTNKIHQVRVVADGGLNEQDIQRMVQDAKEFEAQDQLNRELTELRVQAEGLLYSADRSLQEYGHVMPEAERGEMVEDLEAARGLMDGANIDEMRTIISSLEAVAYRLA